VHTQTGGTSHTFQHENLIVWIQSHDELSRVSIHTLRLSVPGPYSTQLKHTQTDI